MKLFSEDTLAHYGIKGQKKGYNKGKRNGKDVAMTIEELRRRAAERLYASSNSDAVKNISIILTAHCSLAGF